jgi:transcriptional regulator with XRE-family HTH domain
VAGSQVAAVRSPETAVAILAWFTNKTIITDCTLTGQHRPVACRIGGRDGAPAASVDGPKCIVQNLIREILAVSGLTLTRLARQANLAPSTLTKFINNQTDDMPSTRTLIKLTEATGLELSVLPSRPEARPDPEMLRLAMLLALRHFPEDKPERDAELARVGVLTYEALVESEEQGRPITEDAAALAFGENLMRRFLARR